MGLAGEKWREMDDDSKAPYEKKYSEDKERFEKDSLEGVYKNNRGGMYSIFETLHANEYDEYLPSSDEMELLNDLLELY